MIGRYFVVVETARGPFVPRGGSERITTTDHPGIGEWVVLRGMPHVVTRVRHRETGEYNDGVPLTAPVVFVAPCWFAQPCVERRAGVSS